MSDMISSIIELVRRYRNLNLTLVDQAMLSAANFLSGVLLARAMGISDFGVFSLAWLIANGFVALQYSLTGAPMMSIGPKQTDDQAPSYFAAVFLQQIGFACATLIVTFSGALLLSRIYPEWEIGVLIFPLVAVTCAYQCQDFMRRYFFVRGRVRSAIGIDAISYLGQLAVLAWLFAVEGLSPAVALWVIAATSGVAVIVGSFYLGPLNWRRADFRAVLKRHWHSARWMGGATLIGHGAGLLFPIVAGALLGTAAVGALRAAQNMMGIAQALFFALENIVPRRAAFHYQNGGLGALKHYLLRIALFGGSATIGVTLFFAMAPSFWLRLIFGEEFAGYGNLVQWYAVLYVLMFLSVPLNAGLRTLEETKAIFVSVCAGAVTVVFLAYPMIAALGVGGVVIGQLIAAVVAKIVLIVGLFRLVDRARQTV